MTHDRIKELMDQLSESQALVDRLLDCQEAHLREINNLNTAQQSAEQRAEHFKAERDTLQAECEALRRGHDKTHQRIDRALAALKKYPLAIFNSESVVKAIEILAGEGEA